MANKITHCFAVWWFAYHDSNAFAKGAFVIFKIFCQTIDLRHSKSINQYAIRNLTISDVRFVHRSSCLDNNSFLTSVYGFVHGLDNILSVGEKTFNIMARKRMKSFLHHHTMYHQTVIVILSTKHIITAWKTKLVSSLSLVRRFLVKQFNNKDFLSLKRITLIKKFLFGSFYFQVFLFIYI